MIRRGLIGLMLLFVGVTGSANAQQEQGAHSVAMGFTGVASPSCSAPFLNPAGFLPQGCLSLSLSQLFGISGLYEMSAAFQSGALLPSVDRSERSDVGPSVSEFDSLTPAMISITAPQLLSGIGIHRVGWNGYQDLTAVIGLGTRLGSVGIGVSLAWQRMDFPAPYSSTQWGSISLGVQYRLSERLSFGFAGKDLLKARFSDGIRKDILAQRAAQLVTGFSFRPLPDVHIAAELLQNAGWRPTARIGMEVVLIELLSLRIGFTGYPTQWAGGIGLSPSILDVAFTMSHHPDLGFTPSLGVQFGKTP